MKPSALLALLALTGCTSAPVTSGPAHRLAIVSGNSMYPALRNGEVLVAYYDFPYAKLKVTDIILYLRSDGVLICHRIVAKASPFDRFWVVQGDNNRLPDNETVNERNYRALCLPL